MNWEDIIDSPEVISALKNNNKPTPTEVQYKTLAHSAKYYKDVVIAAKTGSGKTLCFGIPTIMHTKPGSGLQALIISPTRELCMQIADHISAVNYKNLRVVCLLGGMAREKQERLLKKQPEVIVATPGRLWEFVYERRNSYARQIWGVRTLVIDEADRMVQMGHFKELKYILDFIYNPQIIQEEEIKDSGAPVQDLNFGYELALDPELFEVPQESQFEDLFKKPTLQQPSEETTKPQTKSVKRQTFLTSATLTIENKAREKKTEEKAKKDVIEHLFEIIQFRGKPMMLDLTKNERIPSKLTQYRINCRDEEKDAYVHCLLKDTQNKTIVFTNSINATRRVLRILALLNYPASKLDGKMSQKQRLKKLEAFKSKNKVLVATDVAGRGLDLPEVTNIVHYSIPRTPEIYIHRCGRTARIETSGTSIALVGPSDLGVVKHIQKMLGKEIGKYEIDLKQLEMSMQVVELAGQVSKKEAQYQKETKEKAWKAKAAMLSGIDVPQNSVKNNYNKEEIKHIKNQIKTMVGEQLPVKRTSVITPELFKVAKEQNLI